VDFGTCVHNVQPLWAFSTNRHNGCK